MAASALTVGLSECKARFGNRRMSRVDLKIAKTRFLPKGLPSVFKLSIVLY